MKKAIIIISGILLLLIVVLVFGYLLMFGTPEKPSDVFANFGIGSNNTEFTPTQETAFDEETGEPIIASMILRQLTTKPIAGMVFLDESAARYVEQGTGYVFDAALESGSEIQVSNTTFTRVRDAIFSPDGTKVVLTYEEGGLKRNILGAIENGGLTTTTLLAGARDFAFNETSDKLNYIVETVDGTEGYTYDVEVKTNVLIFRVPFGSLRVHWGTTIYLYTKPAASLLGYAYELRDGELIPVTYGRFGLTATPFREGVVITETNNSGNLVSTAVKNGRATEVAVPLLPEKCAVSSSAFGDLICATDLSPADGTYPDDWYKGSITMNDILWQINIDAEEAVAIADPITETGRVLDVEKIIPDANGEQFLIMNKTNSTLWLLTPLQ